MGKPNVRVGNFDFELAPIAGGEEDVTVTNAARSLPSLPANSTHAFLQVQNNGLRVKYDGTDPTATVGFNWPAGTVVTVSAHQYELLRLIRSGGADATVHRLALTR